MSRGPSPLAGPTPPSGVAILRAMGVWLKSNAPQAALFAGLGAAATFAISWIAPYLAPWAPPPGPPPTPEQLALAALGWGIASCLACALVGYWFTAGTAKLVQSIVGFPASLFSLFRAGGRSAFGHLLWGAGLSVLAAAAVSPAIGGLVAATFVVSLPSVFGGFVSGLIFRGWSSVTRLFSPSRKRPLAGAVAVAIGLMGSVGAIVAAFLIGRQEGKVVLGLVLVLLAFLVSRSVNDADPSGG